MIGGKSHFIENLLSRYSLRKLPSRKKAEKDLIGSFFLDFLYAKTVKVSGHDLWK